MGGQNCGTRFLAIFHFVYMEASRKSHFFHLEPAQQKVCGGLADRVIKKIPGKDIIENVIFRLLWYTYPTSDKE